jgi:hypothetical protein
MGPAMFSGGVAVGWMCAELTRRLPLPASLALAAPVPPRCSLGRSHTKHTHTLDLCCPVIHAGLHTYIHTYIHKYIHTYIHTYIHAYMLTHTSSLALVSSLLYTYKYTYIHTCIHTHTQTHTYSLALVSSLLYVYIHACARAHAHTHTYSLALVSSLLLLFQHGLGGWGEREGEPGGGRGGSWAALLLSQGVQLFVRITHRLSGCAAPVVMCVCVCVCV